MVVWVVLVGRWEVGGCVGDISGWEVDGCIGDISGWMGGRWVYR